MPAHKLAQLLIDALASPPRDISRMLRAEPPERWLMAPAPGEWSMAQVVLHLAQVEVIMRARFARVIDEDQPMLEMLGAAPDLAGTRPDAMATLRIFTEARVATINLLEPVTARGWLRLAQHSTLGQIKLHQYVRVMISHDTEHLAQMADIRRGL